MEIRLLGTMSATDGSGAELLPAGPLLRGLLARLALDAGRPVDAATLVDALWGETPPATANALQSLVSRLRRSLGADRVVSAPGGYRLDVGPDGVDVLRFDRLRREAATEPDRDRARSLLEQALGLWSGPALADLRELAFVGPAAARLAEARAVTAEDLARRTLGDGTPVPAGLCAVLTEVLAEQPMRETSAVALARVLHATGNRADAIAVLDRTRSALADELGVDPGPQLRAARTELLHDAPAGNGRVTAPAPRAGAAGTPRHRAPALTSFVGREDDLARLRSLVTSARLVTVTGPGGAGKTRIVSEVVRDLDRSVEVAELAPLAGPEQLAATVLHAVGGPDLTLGDRTGPDTVSRLHTALAGRDLLLVLDNCEHLIDSVAALVHELLGTVPGLTVLATSREPLGVPGEVLHPLGALDDDQAARLFTDRAAAVAPGFAADPMTVVEICRRLDGQPLPIELAAARARMLSAREIADRLADRFRLLVTGSRTVLPRHQTLRAVVDWSWDLLGTAERTLAVRFGVFAGPVDAPAVEAVCGGAGLDGDPLGLLAALVEKSLVVATQDPGGGPTRYRMLETIRDYAAARLAESGGPGPSGGSGEYGRMVRAHADWLLAVLEPGEPGLRTRAQLDTLAVLRRVEGEAFRALDRAVTDPRPVHAHRLLAAVAWSWMIRGESIALLHWSDLVAGLDPPEDVPAVPTNRAIRALLLAGYVAGEGAIAEVDAVESALPGLPHPRHPAVVLAGPVARAFSVGDPTELGALVTGGESPWLRGAAAFLASVHAEYEGDLDEQRAYLRVAHPLFRSVGDRFGLGQTVAALGELEDLAGNGEAACAAWTESIALIAELGNLDDLPHYRMQLAGLAARRGDEAGAREQLKLAEDHLREHPHQRPVGWLDWGRAEVERRLGRPAHARALLDETWHATGPGTGRMQRVALLHLFAAAAELDLGRSDAARELLDGAADAAMESNDGPVLGMVAEASARWAVATGDPKRAGELLGIAIARRGTLHLGDPEVVAARDAVVAALGQDGAQTAIDRGRAAGRDVAPRPLRAHDLRSVAGTG
ncbi:BTAD domain-containing putative transcriptional regulator [Pseudonocardia sp. NPDC049635]|uniref:BTAD domain-containing putative transcriptional regulator n=1 Tax=Pseudonocardia sp. NPDC049635 TaxID=3155506 RepID=UPI003408F3EC